MMIENIIFDIGGVLVDINWDLSFQGLASLGIKNTWSRVGADEVGSWMDRYVRGQVVESEFLAQLKQQAHIGTTEVALKQAINSMLGILPHSRLHLLRQLRSQYRLYILSNTHSLHVAHMEADLRAHHQVEGWHELVNHAYYSYDMGLLKPELAIFQQVIEEQHLDPEKTLFIDDMAPNITAAQQCGLQVWHKPQSIEMSTAWLQKSTTGI